MPHPHPCYETPALCLPTWSAALGRAALHLLSIFLRAGLGWCRSLVMGPRTSAGTERVPAAQGRPVWGLLRSHPVVVHSHSCVRTRHTLSTCWRGGSEQLFIGAFTISDTSDQYEPGKQPVQMAQTPGRGAFSPNYWY